MTVLSLEAYLRQEIAFLHDCQIRRDTRGHSRIPCFVIEKPADVPGSHTQFFMKLYPTDRTHDLRQIESIYRQTQVPTAKIVQLGYLPDTEQTYCIYEFITGQTLRELLKILPADQLESIGYRTGQELGKFRQIISQDQTSRNLIYQSLAQLLQIAHAQKRHYNQSHHRKLPRVNLQRLERSLQQLQTVTDHIELSFTHGDINLYNIILHHNQPYFIDTDGGSISLRSLDFRGNCWWGWTGNNTEREQAIYRGIYRGYFTDEIPVEFHQELGFAIIYEFLLRLQRYKNIDEQTYYSFLRWHDIFEQTKYFENYHFDWF